MKKCRRRAAIEPLIGHLKSDFRLSRNYLKGKVGDAINLMMAGCAWNLRKWIIFAIEQLIFALIKRFTSIFIGYHNVLLDKWQN